MLQRITSPRGIVYYISPLLHRAGVPHAFSTRVGGISPPPFDSLNLGNPNGCDVQDDSTNVWQNYRLLQEAIGCADRELCRVHQVHGATVALVRRDLPFDNSFKGDALVSDDPARVLSVRIADCAPILLASEAGPTVAAVHAGWRGIIAGVIPAAVNAMKVDSSKLLAAIGPCIGMDAFEVGCEVLVAFEQTFGVDAPLRARPDGKGHVDLRAAARLQLLTAGINENRIDTTDRCTFRDADEFFSHRRSQGIAGRMAALIAPRAV